MTDTTAAFYGARSFDRRVVPSGFIRQLIRVVRSLADAAVIGVGAAACVCLLIIAVTLAAAWIVHIALATHSDLHARAPSGPAALALAPAAAPQLTFEAKWARATGSPQIISVPQRPVETASRVSPAPVIIAEVTPPLPMPRPVAAQHEIARAPAVEPAPPVAAAAPSPQQAHNKAPTLIDPDSRTAVYDISARTVYLPSGRKLEAHSGLGDKMDNPRYVKVRMRGPTPPNVYELTLRERLFHGVRAIRLNPVDEDKMFGRAGMLAHTYMLGSNGQSNGCVSFRDYNKFLQAFLRGEVDRLVVVPNGGSKLARAARTRRGHLDRYAANSPPADRGAGTW